MALLDGINIPLGTSCPDFDLPAVDGSRYRRDDFQDKDVLIVIFMCNHCPYAVAVEDRLTQLRKDLEGKSAQMVGICANDPFSYPEDSFQNLQKRWKDKNFGFPYLHDLEQTVTKSFGAVCTPEFFVYGTDRKLAYHGRMDDNWKEPSAVKRRELKEAIDLLLDGKQPPEDQIQTMGCSIKWR